MIFLVLLSALSIAKHLAFLAIFTGVGPSVYVFGVPAGFWYASIGFDSVGSFHLLVYMYISEEYHKYHNSIR